jgi:hypothetical protein
MKDVVNKMHNQRPKVLMYHHVCLPAALAISALDNGSAVEAIFLLTFWLMGHAKNFPKNRYKMAAHPPFKRATRMD